MSAQTAVSKGILELPVGLKVIFFTLRDSVHTSSALTRIMASKDLSKGNVEANTPVIKPWWSRSLQRHPKEVPSLPFLISILFSLLCPCFPEASLPEEAALLEFWLS